MTTVFNVIYESTSTFKMSMHYFCFENKVIWRDWTEVKKEKNYHSFVYINKLSKKDKFYCSPSPWRTRRHTFIVFNCGYNPSYRNIRVLYWTNHTYNLVPRVCRMPHSCSNRSNEHQCVKNMSLVAFCMFRSYTIHYTIFPQWQFEFRNVTH